MVFESHMGNNYIFLMCFDYQSEKKTKNCLKYSNKSFPYHFIVFSIYLFMFFFPNHCHHDVPIKMTDVYLHKIKTFSFTTHETLLIQKKNVSVSHLKFLLNHLFTSLAIYLFSVEQSGCHDTNLLLASS